MTDVFERNETLYVISPTRYAQNRRSLTKWHVAGIKMGERVPIFSKNDSYQYPTNLRIHGFIAVPRGLAPWRGLEQSPKRNLYIS